MMLPRTVLYYGSEDALPEQVPLRAGPLTLLYEDGDLRYLRLGDREVVRRIYVAVRDRNWDTIPAALANVELEVGSDHFRIAYDARHRLGEIDFAWHGEIEGSAEGTVTFRMDGEARTTFLRNRIGFCVLHPVRECAGQPCQVEHDGGDVEATAFRERISPENPFQEMRGISYEAAPGVRATLRFEGDLFETEDQRNWTDASFKTFCTPLRLPYPARIDAGTRVRQSVTLTLTGAGDGSDAGIAAAALPVSGRPTEPIQLSFDPAGARRLPAIGIGVASHCQPLTQREVERLKALHLAHLRVDLVLASSPWPATLREAVRQARPLGVPLEAAIILSEAGEEELRSLPGVLAELQPRVVTWLVLHARELCTGERWVRAARDVIRAYDPNARIGGGSHAHFTELNRGQLPLALLDLVCYSINPQVHAFDNASLVETLAAQAETVESARALANGLPVAVSPVTLRPRFNAVAAGPEPDPPPGELPWAVDPRQMSLFGAGWTAGSLKYLAESGAASLTCYETTGWRGVMETERGSPVPERFRSLAGGVFPLYHVLADVGEFAGGEILPSVSSNPLAVEVVALRKVKRVRFVIVNFSREPRDVRLDGLRGFYRIRTLDETNAVAAMQTPESYRSEGGAVRADEAGALVLTLLPYAVVTVDNDEAATR